MTLHAVTSEELVDGAGGGDHHGRGRFQTASRATGLLSRRRDGSRVPHQDRRLQPTDVDAQLQGVGGDDGFDCAFP